MFFVLFCNLLFPCIHQGLGSKQVVHSNGVTENLMKRLFTKVDRVRKSEGGCSTSGAETSPP